MTLVLRRPLAALASVALLAGLSACTRDAPTAPKADQARIQARRTSSAGLAPTGERVLGQNAIEPAYNDGDGSLVYILTPVKAPLPMHANAHAVAPLYLVVYPPSSKAVDPTSGEHFNCEGVPGNCASHDGLVAGVATRVQPGVYGTDSTAVPGHDHLLAAPASGGDFNLSWEAIEVVFTPHAVTDGAVNTRITTEAQLDAALEAGDVEKVDLGFSFLCAVVPARVYQRAHP